MPAKRTPAKKAPTKIASPRKSTSKKATVAKTVAARRKSTAISVETYIAGFPPAVQARLVQMRAAIARLAPQATETISYGIPTFKLHGNLVHYAGYAGHIGFYPGGAGIAAFQEDIASYKNAKGSVQFPHDRPLPLSLVKKIVKFRIAQDQAKAAEKSKRKITGK